MAGVDDRLYLLLRRSRCFHFFSSIQHNRFYSGVEDPDLMLMVRLGKAQMFLH